MRTVYWLLLLIVGIVVAGVVAAELAGPPAVMTPVGTVKDLMEGIIDPSSDVVFEAVSTNISAAGIEERRPRTDEEWATVQHNALMLAEAANLLKVEGRSIARPEQASTTSEPNAPELTPAQIQEKVNADWSLWVNHANDLQQKALEAWRAASARDADRLFDTGEGIDRACENCHLEYWYPAEKKKPQSPTAAGRSGGLSAQTSPDTGIIEGRVRLAGLAPANPVIRMGADPMCGRMYGGKRPTQEIVVRSADGGLANAFVDIQGKFATAKSPTDPVTLDQRGCVYKPRVLGVQVGQVLLVRNSDALSHNVHSLSTRGNDFNVSQPSAGMVYKIQLKNPDVIMRIKCDIHSWMTAYVGVEPHPYFAVSGENGAFEIGGVPAGRYSIRAWHERYGQLTQAVDVRGGRKTTIDFDYTGKESAAGRLQDLALPDRLVFPTDVLRILPDPKIGRTARAAADRGAIGPYSKLTAFSSEP